MFKEILLIILSCSLSFTFSQVQFEKIFEKNYTELPINIRIDQSGIYGISSFDVSGNIICLNSFDDHFSYSFEKNTTPKITRTNNYLKDFVLDFKTDQNKFFEENTNSPFNAKLTFKKSYLQGSQTLFIDKDGFLFNNKGDRIILSVVNRKELRLDFNFLQVHTIPKNFNSHIRLDFPNNLGCADFIGMDENGNSFILVET